MVATQRDPAKLERFPFFVKVNTRCVWICEEKPVLIGVNVVRFWFPIIKSLEPLSDFHGSENLHACYGPLLFFAVVILLRLAGIAATPGYDKNRKVVLWG